MERTATGKGKITVQDTEEGRALGLLGEDSGPERPTGGGDHARYRGSRWEQEAREGPGGGHSPCLPPVTLTLGRSFLLVFCFLQYWVLKSTMNNVSHPFYFYIFETNSCLKFIKLPRLDSNLRSSCLSLTDCWGHRHKPPWPVPDFFIEGIWRGALGDD